MGPLAKGKKRIKLSLDSLVYTAFKLLCKYKGYGHPSRVVEFFMMACLKKPTLLLLIKRIAEDE